MTEPQTPRKKLRLLLCMTSLGANQGGIASTNRNIVRALRGMTGGCELELRVLTHHGAAPRLAPEYLPGSGVFRAEGCGSGRWKFARRYLAIGLTWRPDLVLVDHLHLAVVPYLFRHLVRVPYVLTCHRTEFEEPLGRLRTAAYRGARLRWSNSQFMAGRLRRMYPGVALEVCEPAIDEVGLPPAGEAVAAVPDAAGEPRPLGDNFALIVGRLSAGERYKGHDQLIAAMPAVVTRQPDAQLVIAGGGDDAGRLKELARAGGAAASVLFAGFVTPPVLAGLFARCRLFAMPSRGEGFGVVYLEAMRVGKPCIASRTDGGGEVVADGVSGLLVDPDNPAELCDALLRLHGDARRAAAMGAAGRQRFEERYSFRHFAARLRERLAAVAPELAPAGATRGPIGGLVGVEV